MTDDASRLETIEIKLAHLELILQQLSDEMIRQQRDIEVLQANVRLLKQQLDPGAPAAAASDGYEKPPHY